MWDLKFQIAEVEIARTNFISALRGLSSNQINFKPLPGSWTIAEVAEHIVWAEKVGVNKIWKALNGVKNGDPIWEGPNENEGLTIEEIIQKTWKAKESVPEIAKPKWGGPIEFWIASLESCSSVLPKLEAELEGMDLGTIIFPHPISGPMNVIQRISFLRFHMNRHQKQIERIKSHPNFPS